jgi:hypothetical protein
VLTVAGRIPQETAMVKTTKAQRKALERIYRRIVNETRSSMTAEQYRAFTYRAFRRTVQPTFGCDDCIMVQFVGMWLGIERDGYTHS